MTSSPFDRTADIARWLADAGIERLELEGPGARLVLSRAGGAASSPREDQPAAGPRTAGTVTVASPGMGVLLLTHPLAGELLVWPGDAVVAGQTLALLQVGPVLQPVCAEGPGIVARILRAEGALTGFGDELFEILPKDEER